MASDEYSKRLKQAFLRKAINEGRGPEVIAKLSQLARNKRETYETDDQHLLAGYSKTFDSLAEARPARGDMLDCLSKTDFNREEPPEIREMMMQDLAEQELTIDLLRVEGVPEDKLPKISMALARLNAYERLNAQASGEDRKWHEWTDNDPRIQFNRRRAHEILTGKKLNEESAIKLEVSYEGDDGEDPSSSLSEAPAAKKLPKYTLN